MSVVILTSMKLFSFAVAALLLFNSCDDPGNNEVLTDEEIDAIMGIEDPSLPSVDSSQVLGFEGDTVTEVVNGFPMPNGWVNDYDVLFTQEQKSQLTALVESHFQVSGDEIYIVTVGNISPYPTLNNYTVALGNAWKTDTDTAINNVLIVLSVPEQEVRIESADAFDSRFSDEQSDVVIFEHMMPRFMESDFYGGMYAGVEEIIRYFEASEKAATDSIQ